MKKHIGILFILILLIFPLCSCSGRLSSSQIQKLENTAFNSIFLSTGGTSTFSAKDFLTYQGLNTLLIDEAVKEGTLLAYLREAFRISPDMQRIFLLIDPGKIAHPDRLTAFLNEHPETEFRIMLSFPQLSSLQKLSGQKLDQKIKTTLSFSDTLLEAPNCVLYYPGAEKWLIANSANYINDEETIPQISQKLMLLSFCDGRYKLDASNAEETLDRLKQLYGLSIEYPDFSEKELVFLGDSIFGNYSGMLSIPGMIRGLTGAGTFNLGFGGASAALSEDTPICFGQAIDDLMTPPENMVYRSNEQYEKELQRFLYTSVKDRELCFLLNYGLNDYLHGIAASPRPGNTDPDSYADALTAGIIRLQALYPDARIVLLVPSYCKYYSDGTESLSENGSPLEEYRKCAKLTAASLEILCFDTDEELGITAENCDFFLEDGLHFSENGRFLLSEALIRFLNQEPTESAP